MSKGSDKIKDTEGSFEKKKQQQQQQQQKTGQKTQKDKQGKEKVKRQRALMDK